MLAALAERYPLALLSNKGEELSRIILRGLGLDACFREVLGGDTLPVRKPDPAGLLLLAERLGVPAGSLLMVGDTHIDAETARAAGCPFALVEWGFPRPPGAAGLPAEIRAATAAQLTAALL
jgi:phosphoglycolate phosphatase